MLRTDVPGCGVIYSIRLLGAVYSYWCNIFCLFSRCDGCMGYSPGFLPSHMMYCLSVLLIHGDCTEIWRTCACLFWCLPKILYVYSCCPLAWLWEAIMYTCIHTRPWPRKWLHRLDVHAESLMTMLCITEVYLPRCEGTVHDWISYNWCLHWEHAK